MARTVGIGNQDFGVIRENGYFYVDKTMFLKEWWESGDSVTLITRPRRFGKTLTMSMTEQFFSVEYRDRNPFQGTAIWEEEEFRKLKAAYPVINLTFANVKENSFENTRIRINQILEDLYNKHIFLTEGTLLTETEKDYFFRVRQDMDTVTATMAIHRMSDFLSRYYQKKVILLLDEYDTPMQEAYAGGYWPEFSDFIRNLFNASFKTNPWMERALMTGITRVSRESVFSDLNNLVVVTTTSNAYASSFGFTREELSEALSEYGLSDQMGEVKSWYDGFHFGQEEEIYNPWSVINFLKTGKFDAYWANTSANTLIGKLLRESDYRIKEAFEALMKGETLKTELDEQIVYNQLDEEETAIWSLLLAGGYLKVVQLLPESFPGNGRNYELKLTNYEVWLMFRAMIRQWFGKTRTDYNDFVRALLQDDVDAMNEYMNRVAASVFSFFDTGKRSSGRQQPERFYHGFVLGLLVELDHRYELRSNRESGFGRYDVMLEPRSKADCGYIFEFKVMDERKEKDLLMTAREALKQIEDKRYEEELIQRGVPKENIRKYGFAFQGKKVLIQQG